MEVWKDTTLVFVSMRTMTTFIYPNTKIPAPALTCTRSPQPCDHR